MKEWNDALKERCSWTICESTVFFILSVLNKCTWEKIFDHIHLHIYFWFFFFFFVFFHFSHPLHKYITFNCAYVVSHLNTLSQAFCECTIFIQLGWKYQRFRFQIPHKHSQLEKPPLHCTGTGCSINLQMLPF